MNKTLKGVVSMKTFLKFLFFIGSLTVILTQVFTDFFNDKRILIAVLSVFFLLLGIWFIVNLFSEKIKNLKYYTKMIFCIIIIIILGLIVWTKFFYLRPNMEPVYNFEDVELLTEDGVKIHAEYTDSGKDRTAVLFHGITMNTRSDCTANLAEFLVKDFNVLNVDLRGHGKSGGALDGNEYMDVLAGVDFAKSKGNVRVGVIGMSLGSFSSLNSFRHYNNFDSLVLITPCYSKKIMNSKLKLLNTWFGRTGERFAEVEVGNNVAWIAPEEYIEEVPPVEVLVIGGKTDWVFPVEEAENLYKNLKADKKLIIIPNGHLEKLLTENRHECYKEIKEWFDRTL
ncbi:MAG: alpha/beta fold hydrolase [Armatimonadota bacterium]